MDTLLQNSCHKNNVSNIIHYFFIIHTPCFRICRLHTRSKSYLFSTFASPLEKLLISHNSVLPHYSGVYVHPRMSYTSITGKKYVINLTE